MDAYRPPRERDNDSGDDFQIRGAASRQHRESDRVPPPRRERERDDRYYSNSDDYHRPRYDRAPRDDYYDSRRDQFSESYDMYDEPPEPAANTGEKDVANADATIPFLLIRNLKGNVDEEKLCKGLDKLYVDDGDLETTAQPNLLAAVQPPPPPGAPSQPLVGAESSSLKRVFLIRDRLTDKSMQYGFAEYHDLKNARAALNKATALGDKCTIASRQIDVDFPHAGVFCPPMVAGDTTNPRFQFEARPGASYAYYDTRYYASSLVVNPDPPNRPKSPSPSINIATSKLGKKRGTDSDDASTLDNKGATKSKKLRAGPTFDMWQKKQGELRGEGDTGKDVAAVEEEIASSADDSSDLGTSYIVPGEKIGKPANIKVCLLCGTALNETTAPEKHAHESGLHLKNLQDEDAIKKAHERLKNKGLTDDDFLKLKYGPDRNEKDKSTAAEQQQPQYRDRAKERRQDAVKSGLTTTTKITMSLKKPNSSSSSLSKDRNAKSNAGQSLESQSSGSAAAATSSNPSYGMGLKMLQKAGWSEGQGLGSGDGIAAPIEQNLYAAGVGLGHEGSKKGDAMEEAARLTKNDAGGFLEKTREVARERFNRM